MICKVCEALIMNAMHGDDCPVCKAEGAIERDVKCYGCRGVAPASKCVTVLGQNYCDVCVEERLGWINAFNKLNRDVCVQLL